MSQGRSKQVSKRVRESGDQRRHEDLAAMEGLLLCRQVTVPTGASVVKYMHGGRKFTKLCSQLCQSL